MIRIALHVLAGVVAGVLLASAFADPGTIAYHWGLFG